MIGEPGGVSTLISQEQVNRENQILRDQGARRETEDAPTRQNSTDVASFSAAGLELARTAVTETQEVPDVALEQEPQEEQAVPVSQAADGSSPARYVDIRA
ncbi:MAG: hypothetical protein ACI8ZB_002469 [Desulforhopalus sp.]|jgi:hypothetical protein